jgi:transcriptional regulator GlxA family with amidase domain
MRSPIAGLLDGRRCALHWENLAAFSEQFPRIRTTTDIFVIDGNRYTCSGAPRRST